MTVCVYVLYVCMYVCLYVHTHILACIRKHVCISVYMPAMHTKFSAQFQELIISRSYSQCVKGSLIHYSPGTKGAPKPSLAPLPSPGRNRLKCELMYELMYKLMFISMWWRPAYVIMAWGTCVCVCVRACMVPLSRCCMEFVVLPTEWRVWANIQACARNEHCSN